MRLLPLSNRILYFTRPVARRIARFRQSVSGRILTAAIIVAGLASVVKAVSLAKEMFIARRFGAGDALDAFYVACLLPAFLSGIVGESFNAAFIPTYIEVREREGRQAAERLFSSAAVFNLALLVAVSLLLAMLQSWLLPLLGSGFGPSKLNLTRLLFFISLASLSLSGLNTLWRATLNADERFVFTAISPIMTPVLILAVLLVAGVLWGIYALAIGTVLGVAGELAVSGYGLWRRGRRLIPRWYGFDRSLRKVLAQYAPMVVGAVLMGSTVLVDQAMAAMLGSGSVAALNYANKLLAMILNIGLSSLSIAVLPSLDNRVRDGAADVSDNQVFGTADRVRLPGRCFYGARRSSGRARSNSIVSAIAFLLDWRLIRACNLLIEAQSDFNVGNDNQCHCERCAKLCLHENVWFGRNRTFD
jgi:putative peptidoglycan lipid II flippase